MSGEAKTDSFSVFGYMFTCVCSSYDWCLVLVPELLLDIEGSIFTVSRHSGPEGFGPMR